MLLPLAICCVSFLLRLGQTHSLPPALQLGSAIVAAVEEDAEREAAAFELRTEGDWFARAVAQMHRFLSNEVSTQQMAHFMNTWAAEARGKHKKNKKLLKMLYPLFGAALLAKLILLPLILKWLTALSASSFVMAKIALAAAGLVALKSIVSTGHPHDRLQIVHSSAAPAYKGYYGDVASSASNWVPMHQAYIPLATPKEAAYRPFL